MAGIDNNLIKAGSWHDLKTVLAAVQAGLFILKDNPKDSDLLQSIEDGVETALRIARDSQQSYSDAFLVSENVTDLSMCVQQIVSVFKPLATLNNVKVAFTKITENASVTTPPGIIEQVVSGLLSNAIKFSSSKVVNVEVSDPKTFTIYSTFPDLDNVLKLFTVVERAEANSFNLGVPSLKNLINFYGGDLTISKHALDSNVTVFSVIFI